MKSQYKYVRWNVPIEKTSSQLKRAEKLPWVARVMICDMDGKSQGIGGVKAFATEREAAIHVDKILLEHGRAPVNILKPKP